MRVRSHLQEVIAILYKCTVPHQRREPDGFSFVSGWRCPLCNATTYSQIEISRQSGTRYKTEFYECTGCTVMFRHPPRFTRLGMPVRRWAADVEPRTLREVHGLAVERSQGEDKK